MTEVMSTDEFMAEALDQVLELLAGRKPKIDPSTDTLVRDEDVLDVLHLLEAEFLASVDRILEAIIVELRPDARREAEIRAKFQDSRDLLRAKFALLRCNFGDSSLMGEVLWAIGELPANEQRAVETFLVRNGVRQHLVHLKDAAAYFEKSERQMRRVAIRTLGSFAIKIGGKWFFDIMNPPPEWRQE